MASTVERSIVIDRPIEDVWPYATTLEHELTWRSPWVTALRTEDGGPVGVGTRVHGTTRIMGRTDTYVNEVTHFAPPGRTAWRGVEESGGVTSTGSYVLEPLEGGRTRMKLSITYAANDHARLGELRMVTLSAPLGFRRLLRQLRRLVHEQVPQRAAA